MNMNTKNVLIFLIIAALVIVPLWIWAEHERDSELDAQRAANQAVLDGMTWDSILNGLQHRGLSKARLLSEARAQFFLKEGHEYND